MATNAQVNVVMSDKILVKQLQKELTRMESELRNFTPNTALLKERELQIEQVRGDSIKWFTFPFFLCVSVCVGVIILYSDICSLAPNVMGNR